MSTEGTREGAGGDLSRATGETAQDPLALVGVVAAVMGVSPCQLSDEDGPSTVGSWTSRKQIELLVALEDCYGLTLDHQEVFGAGSIGRLREVLRERGIRA